MQERKLDYIYIRVFATILVVIGHCWFVDSQYGFDENRLPGMATPYGLDLLCRFIYSFHMPLFFALSGALMALGGGKNITMPLTQFAKKKAYRLLFPFLIVTTFYCIPIRLLTGVYTLQTSIFHIIEEQYITLIETHLWFLPCLFFCMIIANSVQRLRKIINYMLSLVILFVLHIFFTVFDPLPVLNWFMFRRSFTYLLPFILGYIISEYSLIDIIRERLRLKQFLFLVFVLVESFYLFGPKMSKTLTTEMLIVSAVPAFFLLAKDFSGYNFPLSLKRLITYIDRHSFEIFLYHAPINYVILRVCELNGGWVYPNWIFFWLRFVLTLSGALLMSCFVRINYGQR